VEFAGIFAGLGAKVDLIMRAQLPLRGFDDDMREGVAEALEAQGVTLHRGTTIDKVEADGDARVVHLANGQTIKTDLVFAAIGRLPNTEGLGLPNAGVAMDGFGAVTVDETFQTSQPGIYAIGDVTNRITLTPVAIAEGHSLAEQLFGEGPRQWDLDRVASAVFTTPPMATVGLTESMITLVYALAMGLGIGATAMVARRIGERDPEGAAHAAAQVIMLGLMVAFVVVILGGMGSIPGAALGGLIFGFGESFLSTYYGAAASSFVSFGAVIALLILRPWGLLGTPE